MTGQLHASVALTPYRQLGDPGSGMDAVEDRKCLLSAEARITSSRRAVPMPTAVKALALVASSVTCWFNFGLLSYELITVITFIIIAQ